MAGEPVFADPCWDLRGESPDKEHASDDVILQLIDGRWAVMHLAWRRQPECRRGAHAFL